MSLINNNNGFKIKTLLPWSSRHTFLNKIVAMFPYISMSTHISVYYLYLLILHPLSSCMINNVNIIWIPQLENLVLPWFLSPSHSEVFTWSILKVPTPCWVYSKNNIYIKLYMLSPLPQEKISLCFSLHFRKLPEFSHYKQI